MSLGLGFRPRGWDWGLGRDLSLKFRIWALKPEGGDGGREGGPLPKPVIQGSHMVSGTRCPAVLLFLGSGVRAGQWPQRADVL